MIVIPYWIALFFAVGALFQGYFFESGYLLAVFVLFIGLGITLIVQKEIRVSPVTVLILGIIALYWISILYAVDREHALLEALRMTALLPLSLLVSTVKFENKLHLMRLWTWIGAGLVLVGVAFHLERKGRLESTLEYANVLAILLLVAWLLCLFFYLKERRSVQLFLLLILGTGILLTFSRAVWVLWGIATVTSLVCLPELRNRRNLLKVGFTHILSCLTAALIKQDLLFFWHRVTSIQPDTAELQIRTVYWRDSLPIIRDYWWGGTGGGGWSLLQYGYQSKQYYVKYVHNHFLQMALDIGVVGLALFIILIVWFYFRAWKQGSNSLASKEQVYWFKSVVIVVSVILLHAGFDFDLSFPLVFGILLCLMSIVTDGDAVQVFKPSQIPFVLVGVVLIPLSLFSIFISFGYQQKEHGIRSAAEGRWDDAHQYFSRAKGLLPWSHSVSYESAKSYVLQGNLSRNSQDYHAAQMELEAALKRAPLEKMYQDLMKDLEKVNH